MGEIIKRNNNSHVDSILEASATTGIAVGFCMKQIGTNVEFKQLYDKF